MSANIRESLSLSNIQSAYGEIASMYELRIMDVERIFLGSISTFFKTEDYYISGDGIKIEHRRTPFVDTNIHENDDLSDAKEFIPAAHRHIGYKTLTKEEFKGLYSLFISRVKRERFDKRQEYVEGILDANNHILYCEKIADVEDENRYLLRPLLSKEKGLDYLVVGVKMQFNRTGESVMWPSAIKRIPIHIGKVKRNRSSESDLRVFKAEGKIMDRELAQLHLDRLNATFMEKYDVDLKLKLIKCIDAYSRVEYTADFKLPLDAIKKTPIQPISATA